MTLESNAQIFNYSLQQLYIELIENEEAKKFFEAETKFNIVFADVNKIIGDAIKDVLQ